LTPSQLRAASRCFSSKSAEAYDHFHVSHFGLLSDEALRVAGLILSIAEARGSWPTQVARVQLPLLEKPLGGFRVIGLFSGLYRVWGKARTPNHKECQSSNNTPY
jgi:hypothetical protein